MEQISEDRWRAGWDSGMEQAGGGRVVMDTMEQIASREERVRVVAHLLDAAGGADLLPLLSVEQAEQLHDLLVKVLRDRLVPTLRTLHTAGDAVPTPEEGAP